MYLLPSQIDARETEIRCCKAWKPQNVTQLANHFLEVSSNYGQHSGSKDWDTLRVPLGIFVGNQLSCRENYIYLYILFFFQINFFLNLFNPGLKIADFPKDFLKKGDLRFSFFGFFPGKKRQARKNIWTPENFPEVMKSVSRKS